MDEFGPNTKSGFCPECAQLANIWVAADNAWHCCYCNWFGNKPDRESKIKKEKQ